jgi:hypothetical protein
MRSALPSTLAGLALLAAAAAGCSPATSYAGGRDPRQRPPAPPRAVAVRPEAPKAPVATLPVKGYGADPESAEQNAYGAAAVALGQWLAENRPDITGWEPTAEYIRQRDMARADGDPQDVDFNPPVGGFKSAKEVRLNVEIRPQNLEEMAEIARHARMDQRQAWAGRGLAGAVAVLLVVAGLLHLEEWTRGYYSRLLRVGAVVLLILLILASLAIVA